MTPGATSRGKPDVVSHLHTYTTLSILTLCQNTKLFTSWSNCPHLRLDYLLVQSDASTFPAAPVFFFEWLTVSNRAGRPGSSAVFCRVLTNGILCLSSTRAWQSFWRKSLPFWNTGSSYIPNLWNIRKDFFFTVRSKRCWKFAGEISEVLKQVPLRRTNGINLLEIRDQKIKRKPINT